jgi:hypothetical protein
MTAQSVADSTALAHSIADLVNADARKSVDHRPPFVLTSDSNPRWSALLEAQLNAHHVRLLVPAASTGMGSPAVHLSVGKVVITGDTARVILTWSRCLPGRSGMNFWRHEITYELVRHGNQWRALAPREEVDGEGRC